MTPTSCRLSREEARLRQEHDSLIEGRVEVEGSIGVLRTQDRPTATDDRTAPRRIRWGRDDCVFAPLHSRLPHRDERGGGWVSGRGVGGGGVSLGGEWRPVQRPSAAGFLDEGWRGLGEACPRATSVRLWRVPGSQALGSGRRQRDGAGDLVVLWWLHGDHKAASAGRLTCPPQPLYEPSASRTTGIGVEMVDGWCTDHDPRWVLAIALWWMTLTRQVPIRRTGVGSACRDPQLRSAAPENLIRCPLASRGDLASCLSGPVTRTLPIDFGVPAAPRRVFELKWGGVLVRSVLEAGCSQAALRDELWTPIEPHIGDLLETIPRAARDGGHIRPCTSSSSGFRVRDRGSPASRAGAMGDPFPQGRVITISRGRGWGVRDPCRGADLQLTTLIDRRIAPRGEQQGEVGPLAMTPLSRFSSPPGDHDR